jgi:hypothetical protein
LLGERVKSTRILPVNTLASMLFINRGNSFEARVLPVEAQLAPAFGTTIADFDGDGHADLFLSQNFFALQPEIPRMDASRGLLLRGDGRGGLSAVPGQASGIKIYGEQRGCAAADFDQDGRLDLVVTQNGAATKLFRNAGARPGVRVRLDGGVKNPLGVGAVVQVVAGSQFGPAWEIRAGGGYWSQDSAVAVLAVESAEAKVSIRWPGGAKTVSAIPAGAKSITIDRTGRVTILQGM